MVDKSNSLIEFVCTANHGRSPLAEAFARQYLAQREILEYQAISSGSHVDEFGKVLSGEIPVKDEYVQWSLEKGLERGLFRINHVVAKELLDSGNFGSEKIQSYARFVFEKFTQEEHDYRDVAFQKFGLGIPKQTSDQLVFRPDTKIVLGMGKENVDVIKEIYDGKSNSPIIETLAGYALGKPGEEFTSGYGGSCNDYLSMAEVIRDHVKSSVDKILDN